MEVCRYWARGAGDLTYKDMWCWLKSGKRRRGRKGAFKLTLQQRNWFILVWRRRSPMICALQAGGQERCPCNTKGRRRLMAPLWPAGRQAGRECGESECAWIRMNSPSIFCSVQTLSGLNKAHPHQREQSPLLLFSLLIQMLASYGNHLLETHLEVKFSRYLGAHSPSNWHIKLAITTGKKEKLKGGELVIELQVVLSTNSRSYITNWKLMCIAF